MFRRVVAALTAAVLVASVVLAGRTYLWCVPMARVVEHCCQAVAPDPAELVPSAETPALRAECCEERSVGDLPATEPPSPVMALPGVVHAWTVLPIAPQRPELPVLAQTRASLPRTRALERAGPASALERCVELAVLRS